jgi:hypothetical protein
VFGKRRSVDERVRGETDVQATRRNAFFFLLLLLRIFREHKRQRAFFE